MSNEASRMESTVTEERGYDELPDWPLPLGTKLCHTSRSNSVAVSPPVRRRFQARNGTVQRYVVLRSTVTTST
jgi:hypothetical protein